MRTTAGRTSSAPTHPIAAALVTVLVVVGCSATEPATAPAPATETGDAGTVAPAAQASPTASTEPPTPDRTAVTVPERDRFGQRVAALSVDVCDTSAVVAGAGLELITDNDGIVAVEPLTVAHTSAGSPVCGRVVSAATAAALDADAAAIKARTTELVAGAGGVAVWRTPGAADERFGATVDTAPGGFDASLSERFADEPTSSDAAAEPIDQVQVARELLSVAAVAARYGDVATAADAYTAAAAILDAAAADDDPRSDDTATLALVVRARAAVAVAALTSGAGEPELPPTTPVGTQITSPSAPPTSSTVHVPAPSTTSTTTPAVASTTTAAGIGQPAPAAPGNDPAPAPAPPPPPGEAGDGAGSGGQPPPPPPPPDWERMVDEAKAKVRADLEDFDWDACAATNDDVIRLVLVLQHAQLLGIDEDPLEGSGDDRTFTERWREVMDRLLEDREKAIEQRTGCERWTVDVAIEQSLTYDGFTIAWSGRGQQAVTVSEDGTKLLPAVGPHGMLWTFEMPGCVSDSGAFELGVGGDIVPPVTPTEHPKVRLHVQGLAPEPPVPAWNGGSIELYCAQVISIVFDDWVSWALTETLGAVEVLLELEDGATFTAPPPDPIVDGTATVTLHRRADR